MQSSTSFGFFSIVSKQYWQDSLIGSTHSVAFPTDKRKEKLKPTQGLKEIEVFDDFEMKSSIRKLHNLRQHSSFCWHSCLQTLNLQRNITSVGYWQQIVKFARSLFKSLHLSLFCSAVKMSSSCDKTFSKKWRIYLEIC